MATSEAVAVGAAVDATEGPTVSPSWVGELVAFVVGAAVGGVDGPNVSPCWVGGLVGFAVGLAVGTGVTGSRVAGEVAGFGVGSRSLTVVELVPVVELELETCTS